VRGYTQGCYAYRCAGRVEVQGPDGAWRACAAGGQPLAAGGDYDGAVECPPAAAGLCLAACAGAPCRPGELPLPCTPASRGGCAPCAAAEADRCAAFAAAPAADPLAAARPPATTSPATTPAASAARPPARGPAALLAAAVTAAAAARRWGVA
jgi:hypothetical protein